MSDIFGAKLGRADRQGHTALCQEGLQIARPLGKLTSDVEYSRVFLLVS